MAGGLVPACYVSQVGTRPPAILDETLSEQSYTRYLEGKLRETFGFRCSLKPRCFSVALHQPNCSDNVNPINLIRRSAKQPTALAIMPRKQNGKGGLVVPTCYVSHLSRRRPPGILNLKHCQNKVIPDIWRASSEKHSASGLNLPSNIYYNFVLFNIELP